MIKSNSCKFILSDGTQCLSPFHTAMYHKPKKAIKRTVITHIGKSTAATKNDRLSGAVINTIVDKKPRKKPTPRAKTPTRSQLVKKLDAVFSKYIRQRDDGFGCVTCGDKSIAKEQMQNCHFFSRGRLPTRWDESNCHSGCYRCNVLLKGNYISYTMYMIDRYGREYVDELEIKSKSHVKISSVEIKEMIEKYQKLLL